ncbi:hypothetical protein PRIPAC_76570 [Pristionchus pacificus]|uniref:G protein-coupled receptor n=1 Tax=Pristionchus pacificus TaxID=54126 RepID=A0A454XW59_PRIPA|nr:hypothetical protein PRIPAC_76570 [Pristionchus pacificus]|eukprot:PDM71481.1 G protein-coupled receptor [Pristionchus pacificus]
MMAALSDYLFLSIETVVNTISLLVMVPCVMTLVRTKGMHGNCRILVVASAAVQTLLLTVQCALFVYDYAIENLAHDSSKELPLLYAQNGLFTVSSCISLFIVLERTFAVWKAAQYERTKRHLYQLTAMLCFALGLAVLIVYWNYWNGLFFQSIIVLYLIEGTTLIVSVITIFYARQKLHTIPYDVDRLNAKYQVREVLKFSMAILPSVAMSSVIHTLSLTPTLLWIYGAWTYQKNCLFYFSAHSLNCILTKIVLISCHEGMRNRFKLLFVDRLKTPEGARIKRDTENEGKVYFDQMKAAWDLPLNYTGRRLKSSL